MVQWFFIDELSREGYYEITSKHYETFLRIGLKSRGFQPGFLKVNKPKSRSGGKGRFGMEEKMRKRGVALLLAAALAVTGLSGCGAASGETSSGREKVRLMVWSPQNDQSKDNGQWLQTMCEAFAEEHPEWDITFVYGVADEASAAGQVSQDPEASADVFMYANDTLTTLTDANALAKFGGTYREQIEGMNSQEVIDSLTMDDNLYGVPFTTNT